MSKIMQIRDVPDDVHDALVASARAQGLSLTKYVVRELERLAALPQSARSNRAAIRQIQETVRERVGREEILSVLHEGRGE